jgi:hypothetical protein
MEWRFDRLFPVIYLKIRLSVGVFRLKIEKIEKL